MTGEELPQIPDPYPVAEHSVDLDVAKRYVLSVLNGLLDRGYYAEAFGYACAREGRVDGYAGSDVEAYARVVGGPEVWPPGTYVAGWDLSGLVRALRFYYQEVAEPTPYVDHSAYGCGMHPRESDGELGRARFRAKINEVLTRLDPRMQSTPAGEVVAVIPAGLAHLLQVSPAGTVGDQYAAAIGAATSKFIRAASASDQKDAVRDLADLLERLRPEGAADCSPAPMKARSSISPTTLPFATAMRGNEETTNSQSGCRGSSIGISPRSTRSSTPLGARVPRR